jgi:hypothetical protein
MRLIARLAAVAAVTLLVPVSAASAKSRGFAYTYKIVKATHTSSVSERSSHFTGTSTETWTLGPKDKAGAFMNAGYFSSAPGAPGTGLFTLAEKGVYKDSVQTDWPASCSLTAPSGSFDYPAVAPEGMMIAMVQKRFGGPVQVAFAQQIADLQNPYFGTECSHPDTTDPPESAFFTMVSPNLFKKRTFTVVNAGHPGGTAGNTTWKTSLTFKRVKTPK